MSAHGRAIMQNVPQNNPTFTNTDGRTSPDLAPRTGPDAISPQEAAFDDAFRAVVDIALAKGLPNELALCETAAKIKQNLTTALAQVDPDQANRAETAIRAIVTSWGGLGQSALEWQVEVQDDEGETESPEAESPEMGGGRDFRVQFHEELREGSAALAEWKG
ncbi:unnamed protein product [Zymoseptoria tritici ST99CH_3D1]|nr:unnamed protein product [Zymoseptoria tritici ST99CH_3D1]